MLEHLKLLVEGNAAWFLTFFVLSVVANVFQILSFLGERRRSREQARERQEDRKRLATYEFLFSRADKQVMSEAELKVLDAEISKRSSTIPELEKRIDLLRLVAKREVVVQGIDRNITLICDAYEELQALRTDYNALGSLPDLPLSTRAQIEAEVRAAAKRPFELPKSLSFRCLLLVLFILLLPWPADTVLTVVFLHVFLIAFFEAAQLSRETEITQWITRHRNRIGLLSAIGAWYMLVQAANNFLARPLETGLGILLQTIRELTPESGHSLVQPFLNYGYFFGEVLIILISVFVGLIHWRTIVGRVLNREEPQ